MYLRKKYLKFFPAGPFFRRLQIKCLSKCPYFEKPPLLSKIPGYTPLIDSKTQSLRKWSSHKTEFLLNLNVFVSCCPIPTLCNHCCALFRSAAFLGSGILKKLLPFVVLPVVLRTLICLTSRHSDKC